MFNKETIKKAGDYHIVLENLFDDFARDPDIEKERRLLYMLGELRKEKGEEVFRDYYHIYNNLVQVKGVKWKRKSS